MPISSRIAKTLHLTAPSFLSEGNHSRVRFAMSSREGVYVVSARDREALFRAAAGALAIKEFELQRLSSSTHLAIRRALLDRWRCHCSPPDGAAVRNMRSLTDL